MASQSLWRMGIAGDLMMHVLDVPFMLILYLLLRPVNKKLALLVVLFNLIQTAVLVANKLNLLMPLILFGNADFLKAFELNQLHALAYVFIKMHDSGFGVGLIFFWLRVPCYRVFDFQIRLFASTARHPDGDRWLELSDE